MIDCSIDTYKPCTQCKECKATEDDNASEPTGTDVDNGGNGGDRADCRAEDRQGLGAEQKRPATESELADVAAKYAKVRRGVVLDGLTVNIKAKKNLDHHEAMHLAQVLLGYCAVMRMNARKGANENAAI